VVVLLALLTAAVNAVASLLQRLGVESSPSGSSGKLVRHAVGRSVWIGGFVLMALGFGAQATALHLGSLAVVQPLLVSELAMVVLLLGVWFAAPMRGRDIVACLAAALGLAGFLAAASPRSGHSVPSAGSWIVVGVAVAAAVALLVVASRRGPPWWRALALGAAASTGFALTAVITKVMTDRLVTGWAVLFETWPLWVLAVVGLSSFVLMQQAFHAGPFTASQASLVLLNPFLSIGMGVGLFGDRLDVSAGAVLVEVVCLAVTVIATLVLVTSPLVAGLGDDRQLLAGRSRWARRRAATPSG
jgi:drug/metabolite transporter (DMT)-like permease